MRSSDFEYLSGMASDGRNPAIRLDVLRMARLDPRLAFCVLNGMVQFAPQSYGMPVKFSSGAADKISIGLLDGPIVCDFWCDDVNFQVRSRPVAFAGNILESFAENQFAQNPHIDASFTVSGCSLPWLFANGFKPIESICRWVNDGAPTACCKDFLMTYPASIKGEFIPRIVLPDPQTELIVNFSGQALGFQNFGGCTISRARKFLESDCGVSPRLYEKAE